VSRIRNHPLVPGHIPIYGFIYDVKTGKLDKVADAAAAGKPKG
jgi:carbonic anhydrase